MASYKQAIETAPIDADYIGYSSFNDSFVVLRRNNDGTFEIGANCNEEFFDLIIAAVRSAHKSFYNVEIAAFECGTKEQVYRDFKRVS